MIDTQRLILRPWQISDIAPFHQMSQDEEVMRYLGPRTDLAEARAAHDRMVAYQQDHGFCFWAMERRADYAFIGFCGLKQGRPPIDDKIEIGWRLRRDAWGQGYAREAAEASLAWGWVNIGCPSIWAITTRGNIRSWGLMERLGMHREPAWDFDHPELAEGDPLRPHLTYSIERPS